MSQSNGETKRQRVPALRNVIIEGNTSIERIFMATEPLIKRVVEEEIKSLLATRAGMMTSVTDAVPCTSTKLQLQFMNKLSLPIFTGSKIEGESSSNITVALVDALTGQVVASGKESLMKVEIVVLKGDFEGGEDDNWTVQEFSNNIVREREGKRPLITGDVFVALIGGIGAVGELSFTDNSSWTRSRKFRLGARIEEGCFNGIRVREAKTESFVVKDHRGELYKKHHPPFLDDEVWRLEKIGKEGAFHKRLNRENIVTIKDFLTLLHLDATRLRKILGGGMSTKMWQVTIEHAKTCVLTDKVHYYYPDNLNNIGVVFNVVGEVRGLISDMFVSVDDLTEKEKADARAAVKQAYEQWKNVITCDSETPVKDPSQILNTRSPSPHEIQYNQFPTEAATDGFGLSHTTTASADIFSMEPSIAMDPCALETEESNDIRFQLEVPPLGGQEAPPETQAQEKSSNSWVYKDCPGHPSFNESCYCNPDPSIPFDSQDLGEALKGFIATISKPKSCKGCARGAEEMEHMVQGQASEDAGPDDDGGGRSTPLSAEKAKRTGSPVAPSPMRFRTADLTQQDDAAQITSSSPSSPGSGTLPGPLPTMKKFPKLRHLLMTKSCVPEEVVTKAQDALIMPAGSSNLDTSAIVIASTPTPEISASASDPPTKWEIARLHAEAMLRQIEACSKALENQTAKIRSLESQLAQATVDGEAQNASLRAEKDYWKKQAAFHQSMAAKSKGKLERVQGQLEKACSDLEGREAKLRQLETAVAEAEADGVATAAKVEAEKAAMAHELKALKEKVTQRAKHAAMLGAGHALGVLKSHFKELKLEVIHQGYACSEQEAQDLLESSTELATPFVERAKLGEPDSEEE